MPRTVFVDPDHDAGFHRDGFIVIEALTKADVGSLLDYYVSVADQHDDDFAPSVLTADLEARRQIHDQLSAIFRARLLPLLGDYRIAVASFSIKQPASEWSSVGVHQDFTFVDERARAGISLWCPLVDVDIDNGCLGLVPGSHRFNCNYREPCSLPYPALRDVIEEQYFSYLPMRAGDALFMDNRMFHGSPRNRSNKLRTVAAGIAVPRESSLLYCHRDLDGDADVLDVYEVPDDFYLRHKIGNRPGEGRLIATVRHRVSALSITQLRAHRGAPGIQP